MIRFYLFIFLFFQIALADAQSTEVIFETVYDSTVITGAEQLDKYLHLLQNKRVAMVVNHTSMIGPRHEVDSLHSLGINITKIFAPEHGFRGDLSDGAIVHSNKDSLTGINVESK